MTCYHPQRAFIIYKDGKRSVSFSRRFAESMPHRDIMLPCGKCIGCCLDKSVDIAVRCVHESLCWSKNCFITLTVDDVHMDEVFPHGSLSKRPFQLFMKRLRKIYNGVDECLVDGKLFNSIRVLYCGEYGDQLLRPHYHALLFNFDFPDKYLFTYKHGNPYYRSPTLERLWPYGFSTIGDITFNSAAYVGRYVTKKLFVNDCSSQELRERYARKYLYVDENGAYFEKMKEFIEFPRGFGLGRLYYDKYRNDIYNHANVDSACKIMKKGVVRIFAPPHYYDVKELDKGSDFMLKLKKKRQRYAKQHQDNMTSSRLMMREDYMKELLSDCLKRSYETGDLI